MSRLRLAVLASCVAAPVWAQQVPAIDNSATASASAIAISGGNPAPPPAARPHMTAVSQQTVDQSVQQGSQGSVPRNMPPAIDPVAPDKKLTAKELAGVTVARRWINKFQTPHLDEDGAVHFTAGKGQVFVVTAVDHVTDIALAPGEIISPPLHFGDPASWRFHEATSGSGRKTLSHIIIKPIDAGLSTNVVIETNKRTLSVALTSRRADYMPLVSLDIPEDPNKEWSASAQMTADGQPRAGAMAASPCDQPPVIAPDQFKITGDDVTWRPVQAYVVSTPVGMKTCIDFPSSIGSEDLPALLALADDGGWFSSPTKKIVNVRYLHRRFIADEQLNRFILVDGVGSDQKSITITRKKN